MRSEIEIALMSFGAVGSFYALYRGYESQAVYLVAVGLIFEVRNICLMSTASSYGRDTNI